MFLIPYLSLFPKQFFTKKTDIFWKTLMLTSTLTLANFILQNPTLRLLKFGFCETCRCLVNYYRLFRVPLFHYRNSKFLFHSQVIKQPHQSGQTIVFRRDLDRWGTHNVVHVDGVNNVNVTPRQSWHQQHRAVHDPQFKGKWHSHADT